MDLFEAQGLPTGSVDWEVDAWLAQFDRTSADGPHVSCYILDFSQPPRVRADSTGFADAEARIAIVAESPCITCVRPTIVIFRRWHDEAPGAQATIIEAMMERIDWHALHPGRKRT